MDGALVIKINSGTPKGKTLGESSFAYFSMKKSGLPYRAIPKLKRIKDIYIDWIPACAGMTVV